MITWDFLGLILHDAIWSALAALGFAVLFNVPPRTLIYCALCGAAGHALRTVLMQAGMGIEISTLLGSTLVGFMALLFARRLQIPVSVFSISGAIPLVPGVFAYSAMIGLINIATADPSTVGTPELIDVVINGVKTGLILIGIAFGIAAPSLIFDRRKPVV